jgi:hypothetical protein
MTSTDDVQIYADTILGMIREDQHTGQVPPSVCSWDELDTSVDADDYYRRARMPSGSGQAGVLRHAVADEITRRLARSQGGPWHVMWINPDGGAVDISRTIGYPTMAEASAVGQEYVTQHGGAFHVQGG